MKLEFVKMSGLGNDFVFIDDLSDEIELTSENVAHLCDRHFGIGADGVILVRPPKEQGSIAYMHYINSDGSLAQMCGNGVRCFAKYLVDRGFAPEDGSQITVDTLAGPRRIEYTTEKHRLINATVDMGKPILIPDEIPVTLKANSTCKITDDEETPCVADEIIESPWGDFRFTCVSMGNPHAICFIDDENSVPKDLYGISLKDFDVDKIGSFFESSPVFPEKTNVEFAVKTSDGIRFRVYERGCAETLACGTGACATLVAAATTNRSSRKEKVSLPGGDLFIDWSTNGHVFMTGSALEVFSGEVFI